MLSLKSLILQISSAANTALHLSGLEQLSFFKSHFVPQGAAPSSEKNSGEDVPAQLQQSATSADSSLTPSSVKLSFLKDTPGGPVPHEATIPILSLMNHNFLQPSEMTFEMDVECIDVGDEIMLSFPQIQKSWLGTEKKSNPAPNAKVTIKFSGTSRPQGVSAIVEGYDKIIKAQIPG